MTSTLIFGLVLGFFVSTTSVRIVPKGQKFIKFRLGKEVGALEPGFHIIIPFIETTIRQSIEKETYEFNIEKIQVAITYQVKDPIVLRQNVADFKSALKVGADSRLRKLLNNDLKASSIDLLNIQSDFHRDMVDLFSPWGVEVHESKLSAS